MGSIEAVDKLRVRGCIDMPMLKRRLCAETGEDGIVDALGAIADEIEREVAERYQILPVDVEGVPIHVGDRLVSYDAETRIEVLAVAADYVVDENGCTSLARNCLHFKHRTLEEVLIDAMQFGFSSRAGDDVGDKAKEYADEIRELIGGSE